MTAASAAPATPQSHQRTASLSGLTVACPTVQYTQHVHQRTDCSLLECDA